MIEYADRRIEILPGGGVTKSNIAWCLDATGAKMIHASAHKTVFDKSAMGNPAIYFGGAIYPPEDQYKMVNHELVSTLCKSMNS
jgi:copper homeostasis protein